MKQIDADLLGVVDSLDLTIDGTQVVLDPTFPFLLNDNAILVKGIRQVGEELLIICTGDKKLFAHFLLR